MPRTTIDKSAPATGVETLVHPDDVTRLNIPTTETSGLMAEAEALAPAMLYPRNPDLDPQLVWRGKDEQDWSDLVVHAPPLYIQEKIHPKVLIDDLLRETRERAHDAGQFTPDLFADFNGIPKGVDKTEFYQHDQNWSNRMILGDSLQVMASLAEREGPPRQGAVHLLRPALRHQVQQHLSMVHHQPRRERRQCRPHHPRARAG